MHELNDIEKEHRSKPQPECKDLHSLVQRFGSKSGTDNKACLIQVDHDT